MLRVHVGVVLAKYQLVGLIVVAHRRKAVSSVHSVHLILREVTSIRREDALLRCAAVELQLPGRSDKTRAETLNANDLCQKKSI